MQITRNSLETGRGPSEWFTGAVHMDPIASPSGTSRAHAVRVHFEPGARTAWHTHPNGQTIYISRAPDGPSGAAGLSRPFSPGIASSSSRARITGTVPRRAAS